MSDHYDRLENRTPTARESALMRDLRHVLSVAKARAPALRSQLKGVDLSTLTSRAALAVIPVMRHGDVVALQMEAKPFGGLVATRLGALARTFISKDMTIVVEGQAKDWWGAARGLYAAGLRKGSTVFNCFPYDLVPDGHMFDAGARAIGCTVVPAGNADLARKGDALARLRPTFFCGPAAHLKEILDFGEDRGINMRCLKNALVTGRLGHGLRSEFSLRGLDVKHAFVAPELGLFAFESGATDGLSINEGLILEIVDPVTHQPVQPGTMGEIVLTRLNPDYPLLRFATGYLSCVLAQPSTCGRTNVRIATPQLPRGKRGDKMPIDHADILEIAKQFPMLGRMRLTLRCLPERDEVHLLAEHSGTTNTLLDRVRVALFKVTQTAGTVEFVEPGSLTDDETIIVDERPLH